MIKNIIFDFDGVILDSVPIKTEAFKKLFEGYPNHLVEEIVNYHILNGGKSRYIKIKYFFNVLLNQCVSEKKISEYADRYSKITKKELANSKYLIEDSLDFIKKYYNRYNLHIASGSDEGDLKYICEELDLTKYFLSINGSPATKSNIVNNILEYNNYKKEETILIGDSINDYDASKANNIKFYGYNNIKISKFTNYINILKDFSI